MEGRAVVMVYMELSMTFGKILYGRLVQKVKTPIQGVLANWIENWLVE